MTLHEKRDKKRRARLHKLRGRVKAHGSKSLPPDVQKEMRIAENKRLLRELEI